MELCTDYEYGFITSKFTIFRGISLAYRHREKTTESYVTGIISVK